MAVSDFQRSRIPLSQGANAANLTPPGLLKILQRTGRAIRDDGHWYADLAHVEEIKKARQILGLDRLSRSKQAAA
jgi:hypothetical protein